MLSSPNTPTSVPAFPPHVGSLPCRPNLGSVRRLLRVMAGDHRDVDNYRDAVALLLDLARHG